MKKRKYVYLYCEKNEGELRNEVDSVSDIRVYKGIDKAVEHIVEKIEQGKKNGFVPETDFNQWHIEQMLKNHNEISITMFERYEENWKCYYGICCERIEVE